MKFSQQVVVFCHGTLTLKDLNKNTRLIVSIRCESLPFLSGNRGVSLNKLCHHTSCCFKPIDNGVTSNNNKSCTCEEPSPVKIAACTAAPNATASSGLIDLQGSFPLKNSWIMACTFGILVDPPTSTTSCTLRLLMPLSRIHFSTGPMEFRK